MSILHRSSLTQISFQFLSHFPIMTNMKMKPSFEKSQSNKDRRMITDKQLGKLKNLHI